LNEHLESAIVEQTLEGATVVKTEQVQRIEIQRNPKLVGQEIRVSEAAEKYDTHQPTLTRWADAGYIKIIERRPKMLLLDEADVDRAVSIFNLALKCTHNPRRAGWILKRSLEA
jgi:hypothetical protein